MYGVHYGSYWLILASIAVHSHITIHISAWTWKYFENHRQCQSRKVFWRANDRFCVPEQDGSDIIVIVGISVYQDMWHEKNPGLNQKTEIQPMKSGHIQNIHRCCFKYCWCLRKRRSDELCFGSMQHMRKMWYRIAWAILGDWLTIFIAFYDWNHSNKLSIFGRKLFWRIRYLMNNRGIITH